MYGILAIYEVYKLRGYGILPYPKFCIQLDCVGMARMPYPPTKKLLQNVLQELFYVFICSLLTFGYVFYSLSSTSLMRSSMWLL